MWRLGHHGGTQSAISGQRRHPAADRPIARERAPLNVFLRYGPVAMPPSSRRAQTRNTALAQGRRETQRERLLAGVVAVANRDGYTATNVSAVIAQARVSRPTFYEYFAGTEDCFLAALADANEQLLHDVREAVAGAARDGGAPALRAALAALVEFARTEPELARFAMSESLGGGPKALAARDATLAAIVKAVEQAHRGAGTKAEQTRRGAGAQDGRAAPDVPLWLAIGTACRVLASRLRRGVPVSSVLREELAAWIEAYARPADESRWRRSPLGPAPRSSPYVPENGMRAPLPLGRGRPRISEEEVAENHRQRLLFAAAALAGEQGYAATTIAQIAMRASLDRRVFYAHFKDKRHIYAAVYDFGFQHLLAVTAGAFFAGGSWPERIWEGARGLTQFLERNPAFAHVGFVEVYAIGPVAGQRLEDNVSAFTVFLQEGYRYEHEPRAQPLPQLAVEAIATSFVELVYHQARASRKPRLRGLLGLLAFVCLAPFLGATRAVEFVEERLQAEGAGRKPGA